MREVWRSHGLSEHTFYIWRRKYAGLQSEDVGKLRDLERENGELKRLLAEQMLENGAMKKLIQKMVGAPSRRLGARLLMGEGLSARRACKLAGVSRHGLGLKAGPDRDASLRDRLRSVWRPNMGYRMAHALVQAEFAPLNVKRV